MTIQQFGGCGEGVDQNRGVAGQESWKDVVIGVTTMVGENYCHSGCGDDRVQRDVGWHHRRSKSCETAIEKGNDIESGCGHRDTGRCDERW